MEEFFDFSDLLTDVNDAITFHLKKKHRYAFDKIADLENNIERLMQIPVVRRIKEQNDYLKKENEQLKKLDSIVEELNKTISNISNENIMYQNKIKDLEAFIDELKQTTEKNSNVQEVDADIEEHIVMEVVEESSASEKEIDTDCSDEEPEVKLNVGELKECLDVESEESEMEEEGTASEEEVEEEVSASEEEVEEEVSASEEEVEEEVSASEEEVEEGSATEEEVEEVSATEEEGSASEEEGSATEEEGSASEEEVSATEEEGSASEEEVEEEGSASEEEEVSASEEEEVSASEEDEVSASEEESDGEDLYELTIKGKEYYTTDPDGKNGIVYECLDDGDVGDEIGKIKKGKLILKKK